MAVLGLRTTPLGRLVERGFWSLKGRVWDVPPDGGRHASRVGRLLSWVTTTVPAPARVLDIGCATGEVAVALSNAGYDVVGVDLSPEMLRRARARPGAAEIRFVEADLVDPLPPGLGSFQVILALGVLQALPDPARAIRTMATRLDVGGHLFVEVKQSASAKAASRRERGLAHRFIALLERASRPTSWVHQLQPETIAGLVREAGLRVRQADSTGERIAILAQAE